MNKSEWEQYELAVDCVARYMNWYGANEDDLVILDNYLSKCKKSNKEVMDNIKNINRNELDVFLIPDARDHLFSVQIDYDHAKRKNNAMDSLYSYVEKLLSEKFNFSIKGNFSELTSFSEKHIVMRFEGDIIIHDQQIDIEDISNKLKGYLIKYGQDVHC